VTDEITFSRDPEVLPVVHGRLLHLKGQLRFTGTPKGKNLLRQDDSLGITKRGDKHLRTRLVHWARAVVRTAPNQHDPISRFANAPRARRGFNRATIAFPAPRGRRNVMGRKRHGAEQIIAKLREAEVELARGKTAGEI
jgi:hypothetical protein